MNSIASCSFEDLNDPFFRADCCSTTSSEGHLLSRRKYKSFNAAFIENQPCNNRAATVCSSGSNSPLETDSHSVQSGENISGEFLEKLLAEQALKNQRLARKAELARISRKRKKDRLDELEEEVKRLKFEIKVLREKNASLLSNDLPNNRNSLVDEVVLQEQAQLQKLIEKVVVVSNLSNESRNEKDLNSLVPELVDCFIKRLTTSKSHLYSLEASISPCMPLRFLNWAMCQDDQFYADPSGMWTSLFKTQLRLSDMQLEQMLSLRNDMCQQRKSTKQAEVLYTQFKQALEESLDQSDSLLSRLRTILTSEQLAKFFVWVDQNQLCVKVLEAVL